MAVEGGKIGYMHTSIAMKRCSVCRQEKPLDCFPKDRARNLRGGTYPRCRDCRHSYYLANRDHCISQMKEYREKHQVHLRAKARAYARDRFFYRRSKNLQLRHPNQIVASYREIARLWKRQRGCCPFTGIRLNKHNAQLDHIIPLIKGGSGTIENLRWVHRDVNYAKRDLSDAQFIALCQQVARNSK